MLPRTLVSLGLVPFAASAALGQDAPPTPDAPLAQTAGQPNSQGTTFQTPGMPGMGMRVSSGMGQVTRFSSEFNPAFSFILDSVFTAEDAPAGRDGTDVALRGLEFGARVQRIYGGTSEIMKEVIARTV